MKNTSSPRNKKSQQKEESHEHILKASADLLRRYGIRGTSVERLMKGAGLTVGGFYAHFRNKEHLVLEAFRAMARSTGERIQALPLRDRWKTYIKFYLSPGHRDEPESGCPVLGLLYDAGLEGQEFRNHFSEELKQLFEKRRIDFGIPDTKEEKEKFLTHFATLLGAQLLARASRGTEFSDEILQSIYRQLEKEVWR